MRARATLAIIAIVTLAWDSAAAHHVMDNRLPSTFAEGLLSGLAHPIIGLDHFAAMLAVGILAAPQRRGAALVVAFVLAMIAGVALHVGRASLPASEVLAALVVVVLGVLAMLPTVVSATAALVLFAAAGAVHGYALGESIIGAEPTPLSAYFAGLAVIQSAVALGAMTATRWIGDQAGAKPVAVRLAGAAIAGMGLALFAQQVTPGA
jgi:urease accessory protein